MDAKPVSIQDRVAISGGYLDADKYWMPKSVESYGDNRYVTLHANDYKLCKLLGVPPAEGGGHLSLNATRLLDHLREKRKTAVTSAMLAFVRSQIDPYCQTVDTKTRRRVRERDLPESVDVPLDNDHMITMRTRTGASKCVEVLLRGDCFDTLRRYTQIYIEEGMGRQPWRRTPIKKRIKTGFKCIVPLYTSCCVYTTWSDGRGLQYNQRRREECDTADARSVRQAVKRCINFLRDNHHSPLNNELVLASEHMLDMFAPDGELAAFTGGVDELSDNGMLEDGMEDAGSEDAGSDDASIEKAD